MTYNEPSQIVPMMAIFRFLRTCNFRRGGSGKSKMIPSKIVTSIGIDSANLK